ncbi:class II glutamine amidotransferase [Synechococcus sp. Tobar12-5m-g]|uniref:class II glutamine amidotransferase n=1 Tax=unclassified Synechococcus TaxID=2626047 RepID=UPI0020CD1109|nr:MULTISPECIES: class II glutamine amidotransferase [unclassified Synechococcus]MCP9773468.1 class II glutamine amidotransferase [Synechococcus sp. Tobar12-5m-g]MCP9874474.1 class II glutamine amidotransferase [Synechococcus sp. Cruz CV-v-12]
MCELLALSANTPTDMTFSFRGLVRRGGATGDHGDGWGLASYDPEGLRLTMVREEAPAAFSPVAAKVSNLELKAHCSIAHIRKATQGSVAIENCHPFHRHWQGLDWVFAHNGDLDHGRIPTSEQFVPLGSTDSERAFCWILDQLASGDLDLNDHSALFAALIRCADHLAVEGIFNCLLSNGHWLFVYGGTKLHVLTRRAPFTTATLADDDLQVDFSQVTTPSDVVTIVSTEPLTTDELWRPLLPSEALLLVHGEVELHHVSVVTNPLSPASRPNT